MKTKKRLAKFSKKENAFWTTAFEDYINLCGKSSRQADELAWKDVIAEFPRLKKYDGAKP